MSSMEGGFIKKIVYYEETDSTNIRARKLAEVGAPDGTLVVTDFQNAGRGRRGRMWVSPSGTGIFMSLILRPDILPSSASMLTLVAALAVYDGIKETTGLETVIKWPNDIVAEGKKLCGILTEMSAELEGIHYVVTGIGINANMTEFPEEVGEAATSLRILTGGPVRRSRLIAAVMKAYEGYYEKFKSCGSLAGLMDVYNERMANLGREVKVLDPAGAYTGKALGIDEKGELIVEKADGKVVRVVSGEVSVRGKMCIRDSLHGAEPDRRHDADRAGRASVSADPEMDGHARRGYAQFCRLPAHLLLRFPVQSLSLIHI